MCKRADSVTSVMSKSLQPHRVKPLPNPQAPLSVGFSRQEYWSGLHTLLQGGSSQPKNRPASPESLALQANVYRWATGEALPHIYNIHVLKSLLFSPPVIPSNYSIKYLVTCTHQSDCNSSEGKKRILSFHKIIYPVVHFALVKKKRERDPRNQ